MNYISETDASCLVFWFSGQITFRNSLAFEAVISEIAACSQPWVQFDLADVNYIDSYGIGLLALARDAAEQAGAQMELLNARGSVAEVLGRIAFDFVTAEHDRSDLRISTLHRNGSEARVALAGTFRVKDQGRFLPLIQSAISDDFGKLVIDVGQLRFIDSIGVSLIMTAADEARKAGKELTLSNPQGEVRELLRLTAIDTVVAVEESLAAAYEALLSS